MGGEAPLKNKDPKEFVTSCLKAGFLTYQPSFLLAKAKYLCFSLDYKLADPTTSIPPLLVETK